MEHQDSVSHLSNQHEIETETVFHYFPRLPYELRFRIWQDFAPQLSTQPLLLQFTLDTCSRKVFKGPSLKSQTQASRAALATHQESRHLALRVLPDSLLIHRLDGLSQEGVLHLKLERDIVLLEPTFCFDGGHHGCNPSLRVPGFSECVVNLGMNFAGLEQRFQSSGSLSCFPELGNAFSNVKALWSCGNAEGEDIFRFRPPLHPMSAADGTRPWCYEPSTWEVLLEGVGSLFVDIKPDVEYADVFIPDIKNPLIHEEVNRMTYRVVREEGDEGPLEWHDVWSRFFYKGSAFEWFKQRLDGFGDPDDSDADEYWDGDYADGEEIWRDLVEGEGGKWLKDVEMWPLVAR